MSISTVNVPRITGKIKVTLTEIYNNIVNNSLVQTPENICLLLINSRKLLFDLGAVYKQSELYNSLKTLNVGNEIFNSTFNILAEFCYNNNSNYESLQEKSRNILEIMNSSTKRTIDLVDIQNDQLSERDKMMVEYNRTNYLLNTMNKNLNDTNRFMTKQSGMRYVNTHEQESNRAKYMRGFEQELKRLKAIEEKRLKEIRILEERRLKMEQEKKARQEYQLRMRQRNEKYVNSSRKCINTTTLVGDEILDIPENNMVYHTGYCFEFNELVNYIFGKFSGRKSADKFPFSDIVNPYNNIVMLSEEQLETFDFGDLFINIDPIEIEKFKIELKDYINIWRFEKNFPLL